MPSPFPRHLLGQPARDRQAVRLAVDHAFVEGAHADQRAGGAVEDPDGLVIREWDHAVANVERHLLAEVVGGGVGGRASG